MDREKFVFRCKLTPVEGGPVTEKEFSCYWSPAREDSEDAVKTAAAAMESHRTKVVHHCVGIEQG